ncbi:MAG: membrane protein insertase YidC [Candidatus Delongbacteria bacterium]
MEPGLDKRTILAFIIIGLLVLFMSTDTWRRLVGMPTSEELAAKQATVQEAPPAKAPPIASTAVSDSSALSAPTPAVADRDSAVAPLAAVFEAPAQEWPERTIRVETDQYVAVFSTRGASLVSHELKGLKSYRGDTVVLLQQGSGNLSAEFNLNGRQVETTDYLFACDAPDQISLNGDQQQELVFTYTGRDGGQLVKRYLLRGSSYRMDVGIALTGLSEPLRHHSWGLHWNSGLALTESSPVQDNMYTEALALVGSELEGYRLGRKEAEASETRKGTVHWVATRNKYFELALVPLDQKADEVTFTGRQDNPGDATAHGHYAFTLELPLTAEQTLNSRFALYLGPLQKHALADMDPSLQQSIMTKTSLGFMGFMWPLIKPFAALVLWVFTKLHLVISNYGVIILIFSVLVKVAVWPLTSKSHRSMKEMQRIRPLQEELKRKYAKNPQKMQEETMKLFREHKVNPFGGCLPNLLQMPLLFSLYFVFRGAFELRGASFVGWITDLSVPDSIFTLPFSLPLYGNTVSLLAIVFAISNYVMMKMSMTDPNQKAMMYMMPIMMLFIFNQLPSGLTLYYTLFNILSAVQQQWLTGGPLPPVAPTPESPKGKKLKLA